MQRVPAIAIFDIGKTNKKLFLFDKSYRIIWETTGRLEETRDEDGFPAEDLRALAAWIRSAWEEADQYGGARIEAINFSGYGASLVLVDERLIILAPIYNYLKPYPEEISQALYKKFGGQQAFTLQTGSPALGSLNSGLQLLRLQKEKPALFSRIRWALHFPQWLSSLFTGEPVSDLTSIGCHTALWDFRQNAYHAWTRDAGLTDKLAPVLPSSHSSRINGQGRKLVAGIGLHDSSAALIPYLLSQSEPFLLLSTGTWNISLNPFNRSPLSAREMENDCLCYMDFRGRQVKASRLFSGFEHEKRVKEMAAFFQLPTDYYRQVAYDPGAMTTISAGPGNSSDPLALEVFAKGWENDFAAFRNFEAAYHHFIHWLVQWQKWSTGLVLAGSAVKKIFVDGGFAQNPLFMQMLAAAFPEMEVLAATVSQASALGAALAIHDQWNPGPLPEDLVQAQKYCPQ